MPKRVRFSFEWFEQLTRSANVIMDRTEARASKRMGRWENSPIVNLINRAEEFTDEQKLDPRYPEAKAAAEAVIARYRAWRRASGPKPDEHAPYDWKNNQE